VIRHAGLIARLDDGRWRGVLIEGPSGSGKSDLALRAVASGWSLIADDRTLVWTSGERLYGRAVPALEGLIEARGLGVIAIAGRAFASVELIVRCAAGPDVERAPDIQARSLLGVAIPRVDLVARHASALVKLAHALSLVGHGRQPAYQTCRAGLARTAAGDP
jgi:serine kinase of HPr protein (carbohydrate metabolism regulator)